MEVGEKGGGGRRDEGGNEEEEGCSVVEIIEQKKNYIQSHRRTEKHPKRGIKREESLENQYKTERGQKQTVVVGSLSSVELVIT